MATIYEVQQGDCLSSIAARWGFSDFNEIYMDGANAGLREKRPNPNIIFPGDLLVIPDREVKDASCPTDQLHRFVVKRPKVLLRVCLKDDLHRPYRNTRYELKVGNRIYADDTDSEGMLEQPIDPAASTAELTIYPTVADDPADPGYTFALNLGHLDPVEEDSGVEHRLSNLGFAPAEEEGGASSDEVRTAALRAFQKRFGLDMTGEVDDATRGKLRDLHDGE
jgi:N-acetylmuramoyl-L-alanine amidase